MEEARGAKDVMARTLGGTMKDPKSTPPIRRVMKVSTGTTLEWTPRPDGGLDLGVGGTMYVALTAEEFGWFMDDLRAIKPPGPVYREGGLMRPIDVEPAPPRP